MLREGLNIKNKFVIKSNILVFYYNIYCQIINNVSMYGILNTKKFIKHSLRLLLPLMFASWCLPYETPVVISQNMWTLFPRYLFLMWEIS
jgi:hypothetical protein